MKETDGARTVSIRWSWGAERTIEQGVGQKGIPTRERDYNTRD